MNRAVWDRAIGALRRVLGIGLSWVLVWLVFLASLGMPIQPESITPGELVRRLVLGGLLLGIPFGVALEIAGRGRRASELSLVRTLTCAFLACALVQTLQMLYFEHRDLGLGLGGSVRLALAGCVFGQFVTLVWYAAVRGGARARVARHFETPKVSVQVLIDLALVLLACWLGFVTSEYSAYRGDTSLRQYRGIILLTAAVTVGCFYCCGMYRPPKSRIDRERLVGITLSTAISFLVVFLSLVMLQATRNPHLVKLSRMLDLGPHSLPGGSLLAFPYLFALLVASRLAWFRVIDRTHRRGIGV